MILMSSIYPILCEVMNVLILQLCVIFVFVNTFGAVNNFITKGIVQLYTTRNNKNIMCIYIYIINRFLSEFN